MGVYARRRARQLNRNRAGAVQERTLLRLVEHARHTRFGRDHDFGRIRSVADFQERVPLRDYEGFWSGYWKAHFPFLQGVTWPDAIPYMALSSGTTTGTTKYLPLSRQLLDSNTKAALTTIAWFLAAHPGTPLFAGRLFFLGGSTDLVDLGAQARRAGSVSDRSKRQRVLGGDLSGITSLDASPL